MPGIFHCVMCIPPHFPFHAAFTPSSSFNLSTPLYSPLTTLLQGASVSDITFFDDVASNHKGKGNAAQTSRATAALSVGDARRAAYALGLKKDMRNKRK